MSNLNKLSFGELRKELYNCNNDPVKELLIRKIMSKIYINHKKKRRHQKQILKKKKQQYLGKGNEQRKEGKVTATNSKRIKKNLKMLDFTI